MTSMPTAISMRRLYGGDRHDAERRDCVGAERGRYTGVASASTTGAAMTATIIDGKAIAQQVLRRGAGRRRAAARRGIEPGLAVVLVGDNPASVSYVRGKARDAAEVGMRSETIRVPADISQDELLGAGAPTSTPTRAGTASSCSCRCRRTSTRRSRSSAVRARRRTSTACTRSTSGACFAASRASSRARRMA